MTTSCETRRLTWYETVDVLFALHEAWKLWLEYPSFEYGVAVWNLVFTRARWLLVELSKP